MNQLIVKVFAIFGIFFLTLFAGTLPYKIGHGGPGRRRFLSYCNCFAGGVFLATSLLDLLPMIREKFQAVFNERKSSTVFPVAEFTTCIGFFLVLIVEQIIHTFHNSSLFHGHGHEDEEAKAPLLKSSSHQGRTGTSSEESNDSFATRTNGNHVSTRGTGQQQTEGSLRTYILVFALSLHSIFEGLALGLIVEIDRLVQVAVAVLIHKTVIAFSMGVSMVQHNMNVYTIVKAALIFSIMGPIGIGIGIGVLNSSSQFGSNLSSGILQGIANGTFLFVTFFEILQSELSRQGNRLLKVLFMLVGYSIVTCLLYYANSIEEKSHELQNPYPTQPSGIYNRLDFSAVPH